MNRKRSLVIAIGLLLILILFIYSSTTFSAPAFVRVVNDKEKLFGSVLVADDWGSYPLPEKIPEGWKIEGLDEWRKMPDDYFDLGQVDFRTEGGKTKIYVQLYGHFRQYNESFTLSEFRDRVERIKEIEEIKLEIDPSVRKFLEEGVNEQNPINN